MARTALVLLEAVRLSESKNDSEFAQEPSDAAPERDYTSWKFWLFDGEAVPWKQVAINVLAIVAPPIILGLLFGTTAGIGGFMGALPATIGARRSGAWNTAPFVLLAAAGGYLALNHSAWAPGIGAALAMVAGFAGRQGKSAPAIIAIVPWTIYTGQIIPQTDGLLVVAGQIGGLLWAITIIKLFGAGGHQTDSKPSRAYALVFGVLFAIGIAIATWVGQNLLPQHGFWFPLCLAILTLPPHTRYFTRAIKRVVGTAIGCLLAYLLGSLHPSPIVVGALAIAGFVATQKLIPQSQIIGSAAITVSILLFIGERTPLKELAVARLVDFAGGAGLAALLALCGVVFLRFFDRDALQALQQR